MIQNKPRPLTEEQIRALEEYSWLRINLNQLGIALRGAMEFNFEPGERQLQTHFAIPEPGLPIRKEHISNALEKKRTGEVSESDLVYWAAMLLMNDAYELDHEHEDVIAEWLNDMSFNLDPTGS